MAACLRQGLASCVPSFHPVRYNSTCRGLNSTRVCHLGKNSPSGIGGRRASCAMRTGRKVLCFFNFGKPQVNHKTRDDFDRTDVEEYFNYMGMLAVEGSYDKMEALLNKKIDPVDILLLLAASEGDKPKIKELMQAGADYRIEDVEGKTALDRSADPEIRNFIMSLTKSD